MVKQSQSQSQSLQQEGHRVANEELNEDLILRCWKGVEDQVNRVREFNRSQGVPNVDNYIGYHYDGLVEPMSVKQKRRFLSITKHKKTGQWRTVQNLIESGTISDIEKEVFSQGKFPRIECHTMIRVKTRDNKEYLMRGMRVYGLSEIGAALTLPLYDADFTKKIPISADTAKDKDGNDVKILVVGSGEFTFESPATQKIYLVPFTKENVLATLEKYPQSEDNDTHGKMTYSFKEEDVPNGEISISSLEEFLTEDFEGTFERIRAPAPTIQFDSKDLHNYLKSSEGSKEKHTQYG